MRPSWLAPVVLALSVHFSAGAATPLGVNYQGFLVDSVGNPVNGQVDILLSVWAHPTSTAPVDLVYQEIHLDKLVVDGVYDVVLGNGSFPSSAFGSGLFAGADRWLQVQIEAEILTPRQKLQSVVYALQADVCTVAANATRFDGLNSTFYQRTISGTCPPGQSIRAIASDGLTVTCEVDDLGLGDITDVGAGAGLTGGGSVGAVSLAIATGGVTSAHIADGVIANVDVAAGAAIDPLKISGTAGIRNFAGVQTFDGSTFAIDATLNRVGVGTAVPGTPLDVVGQIRTTVPVAISPSVLRWASVPGSAFHGFENFGTGSPGYSNGWVYSTATLDTFWASIQLPDSASPQTLACTIIDNLSSHFVSLSINRIAVPVAAGPIVSSVGLPSSPNPLVLSGSAAVGGGGNQTGAYELSVRFVGTGGCSWPDCGLLFCSVSYLIGATP